MNLVPYTLTALSRQDIPDTPNDRNIVVGAVVTCTDSAGATVTMFDDAAGSNGSTAKQTGVNGQVTVYIEPGEYTFTVNGQDFKVAIFDGGFPAALAAPDSTVLVGDVEARKIAGSNAIEINYTVGSSGDFLTLNAALAFISVKHRQAFGGRVNLLLLTGFELTEQLIINTIDLSFVRVTSVDSVVAVNPSVWSGTHEDVGYKPAIAIRFGAVSPIFDVVFDAGETVTADEGKAGFIVRSGATLLSSGQNDAKLGFKNLNGRGCYVFQNATTQINFADFSGCFVGHRCSNQGFSQIRWGNVANCVSFGLMCDSSYINASAITGSGCDRFAIVNNNGNLMCINAVAQNCTTEAFQIVDNGKMTATDADFSGSGAALIATGGELSGNRINLSGTSGDAIDARTGARLSIPSANLSGKPVGIRARLGARVDAASVNASGCGFGVIAENAEVYCEDANLTGCSTGIYANKSGIVRANGANVSGATSVGVNAAACGQVIAHGLVAENCARPMQASGGGEIRANNGRAINRTSQIRVLTGGVIYATGLVTDSGTPALADFTGVSAFNTWSAGGIVYVSS